MSSRAPFPSSSPFGARFLGVVTLGLALLATPRSARALDHFSPGDAGVEYPDSSDGTKAADPTIRAYDARHQEIHVDGRLDEPAWQAADAGRGFTQWDPDRRAAPAEQTVFKVAYDEGAIYFAVACYESDPTKIRGALSRRDTFANSDVVAIYIDPYHDRTTGYAFKVNPLGVQQDVYVYHNGDTDNDWDAVWEAETSRDQAGWYAEIRIPFSAIRYRSAPEMTWGLDVWRYMQGRGQDTAWKTWPREASGFVSQFGTVSGIRDIRPPRQLELLPYVLQGETDPALTTVPGGPRDRLDGFQNVGLDLKYGVTSDLTLNATIQPDFGQVEADPAVLNLSPFETFFDEKRPFFIEGNRFFEMPNFNLFYSRRIGTGDVNSRIRYAAKMTGKTVGGISVAALAASTDLTGSGQAHNIFKNGERLSRYFVGRFGKEFSEGRNRVNVMQTAVLNTADRATWGDRASREAYTTGLDFDLNNKTRLWNLQGSFVSTVINPEAFPSSTTISDKPVYGSGGEFSLNRLGGKLRGNIGGRWESAKLQLNDLGYLESPDEIQSFFWMQRRMNLNGKSKTFNSGNINYNLSRSWIYAGRKGIDPNTNQIAWEYGAGHKQYTNTNINSWMQFRNYREAWYGVAYNLEGTHRWETRGGPLIREPRTYGGWAGASTDTRKTLVANTEWSYYRDTSLNHSTDANFDVKWKQSSAVNHEVKLHFQNRKDDTQYLQTVDVTQYPGGKGIGGYAYVFGRIHQQLLDVTFRSNILFSRKQSLEIYAQPFITVGDYDEWRELSVPDSYRFIHYDGPLELRPGSGVLTNNVRDFNFSFASVNTNVVYRWEYRPGSTFYLVWTQSRADYQERWFAPSGPTDFQNNMSTRNLFRNEPENRILAKVSYWLPI